MKTAMTRLEFMNGRRKALITSASLTLAVTVLRAQDGWKPTRPIKLVVPFAAGGGADAAARLVGKGLSERLGQPVIVENRAGASGAIGSEYVYNAPPDATVLLAATGDAQAVNPHLHALRFDSTRFVPLAGITLAGFVLMGRLSLPAENILDLKKLASKQSLTYSSGGGGTAIHVVTAAFASMAKFDNLLHVPYQGGGPAITALLAGQVDLMMVPGSIAAPYLSRARVYGITGSQRNRFMPGVPTLSEQGVSLVADSWTGIVAPPGMPTSIASALADAIYQTVNDPAMQKLFSGQGKEWFQLGRKQFEKYYKDQYSSWGEMIKAGRIMAE